MPCLKGLKVIDLSRVLAGPFACQILGDLGAEVIKIERPPQGDDTRQWGPPYFEGDSAYFLSANRNKKSVALDFRQASGRERARKLIGESDILIENFKHGSLKKFSLDYQSLGQEYPKLIYCSIHAFDQQTQKLGYDILVQAMAGLMSITGKKPTKVGVAVTDLFTGLYAVIAVLSALRERETSGKGQHIDLSLYDSQVSMLSNVLMNFLVTQELPEIFENAHASIVPYQSFDTADKELVVAVGNDQQFEEFCEILEQSWHCDPRFKTNPDRVKNRLVLCELIQKHLKGKTRAEWLEKFSSSKLAVGPINDLKELGEAEQTGSADLLTTMSDQVTPCIRSPLKFSRTPIEDYRRPPKLGEHSKEIFE